MSKQNSEEIKEVKKILEKKELKSLMIKLIIIMLLKKKLLKKKLLRKKLLKMKKYLNFVIIQFLLKKLSLTLN